MPTFENIDVLVDAGDGEQKLPTNVDFEVFCARCGAGLCNQSDTRLSRIRRTPQVAVEPCECCTRKEVENAKDEVRDELGDQIDALKSEVSTLESTLAEMEKLV